jgi:hypothetical protein
VVAVNERRTKVKRLDGQGSVRVKKQCALDDGRKEEKEGKGRCKRRSRKRRKEPGTSPPS